MSGILFSGGSALFVSIVMRKNNEVLINMPEAPAATKTLTVVFNATGVNHYADLSPSAHWLPTQQPGPFPPI